jgi:hypothetical protein
LADHGSDLADQKRLMLKALRSKVAAHLIAQLVDEDPVENQALGQMMSRHLRRDLYPELSFSIVALLKAASGPQTIGSAVQAGEGVPGPAELLFLRSAELGKLPSFQSLKLGAILENFVDAFLAQPGEASDEWVSTSRTLRRYLADRLQAPRSNGLVGLLNRDDSSDVEDLLALVAFEPARFRELLELLGRTSGSGGELESFIELARRSLQLASGPLDLNVNFSTSHR